MPRAFQRRIEDFRCGRCGAAVRGDGYTNHCSACLWSRHVDVAPGDRAAECGGMMEPVAAEPQRGSYVLLHRCRDCGADRRCRVAPEDAFEAVLEVAQRAADPLAGGSAARRPGRGASERSRARR